MSTNRNLLFGVLALQVDLIDSQQFAEACTLWTAKKNVSLADVLVEMGSITEADRSDVERFVERRLRKHEGDIQATLAASADESVYRSLAKCNKPEIERSLVELSKLPAADLATTVHHLPDPQERYALTSLHAGGAIGRVWLARDRQLRRDVALKELRPQIADSPSIQTRFLNEAQVTAQLEHPGIVPVYELAHRASDQRPYYTMRFVNGRTLSEAIRDYHQEKSEEEECSRDLVALLSAFVAVCNTVAYAHSRGVIHRDLKGQNIILGEFGEVIVLDWGLAKLVGQSEDESSSHPVVFEMDSQLTMDGAAIGTPAYMAPEQAEGRLDSINHRTDIYGLGAILYEILAGQPPFTGSKVTDILRKVIAEDPVMPSRLSTVPKNLESICLRAIAKNPSERHESASELAEEVLQWQEVQRQQAIQALKDSEALFHGLVETLPLVIWRKDREGRFVFMNQGHCDMVGRNPEEVIGRTDFDLFLPELASKYRSDDQRVLETGGCFETEEKAETADRGIIYVHTVKTPVHNAQGEIIGTQGFLWDVTEHKKLQEVLEQKTAELEECRRKLQLK